jgi:aldose 1-epimerase
MNNFTVGGLKKEYFQKEVDNKPVDLYILTAANGMEMSVTNFGAKIVTLNVPDRNGKSVDVVLGHNNIDEYLTSTEPYFGAVCGRVCNRIAKGHFTLDGKEYQLAVNNGPNHLHGGIKGFNAAVWDAEQIDDSTVELTYISPDGEEGYPGTLTVKTTYHLTDNKELKIAFEAQTDKTTIVNLTNHSYFNLSGAGDPYIGDHLLHIRANYYLPTDKTNIPYGEKAMVHDTPMDFISAERYIGDKINEDFEQLTFGKGYDHTYILIEIPELGKWRYAAEVSSPKTGICMSVFTSEPGVQLYTGNWLKGDFAGKYGHRYPVRSAFCLETQHYPDSVNKLSYPSVILHPGEIFKSQTFYKFNIDEI